APGRRPADGGRARDRPAAGRRRGQHGDGGRGRLRLHRCRLTGVPPAPAPLYRQGPRRCITGACAASEGADPTVTCPEVSMSGRCAAVIIGVNRSPTGPSGRHLRYAEADATALHALLTGETGVFHPADVELLVGESATASGIVAALRRATAGADRCDA